MRETTVKTRKEHRCDWCPELIEIGQPAISRAYMWEGEFFHGYLHPECMEALKRSDIGENGFDPHAQKRGIAYDRYGEPKQISPNDRAIYEVADDNC